MSTTSFRFSMSFDVVGNGQMPDQVALITEHMNETIGAMAFSNTSGDISNDEEEVIGYWRFNIVES